MRLTFLVPNNAWAFIMGETVIQVGDSPRFFSKLSEAVATAKSQGLTITKGKVEVASN